MEYVLPHSIYPLNGQSISGNGRLVVGVAHVPDTPPTTTTTSGSGTSRRMR